VERALFHSDRRIDGQTDRQAVMTKLIVDFSQCCECA